MGVNTFFPLSYPFLSCVTCCCYKLLENPTISHVKSKPTRDGIIHLLGILIKKYNHLLGKYLSLSVSKTEWEYVFLQFNLQTLAVNIITSHLKAKIDLIQCVLLLDSYRGQR